MSTPSTAVLRTERVPIELWLQIIRFADCEQRDLANLTLVSKFLAWVVQPLLFADFTVTLLRAHLDGQVTKCQHTAYHTRMLERLQFLKSERIAHNVKSISICLHPKAMHLDPEVLVGADEIVNEVFSVLAYLPHLKAFHGHEVHLTSPRIEQLVAVQYLEGLHFNACSATIDVILPNSQLRHLSLYGEMGGPKFGWWIPLLRSPSLTHLSYNSTSIARKNVKDPNEALFPAIAIGPVIKSLQFLRLPCASPRFPCFEMALSKCSSVQELLMDSWDEGHVGLPIHGQAAQVPLPSNILPQLRAINAPYMFISRCLQDRPISHITVSLDIPWNALRDFETIRTRCPQLEELVLTMNHVPLTRVLSFALSFSRLRGLRLEILNASLETTHKPLFGLVKDTSLPRGLKSLRIYSRMISMNYSAPTSLKDVTNKKKHLIRAVRRKCPKIVDIHLSTADELIAWQRPYTTREMVGME
ncbi:hypothetical protein EIP86_005542 [Pleurotus ostreatoroseus]|nr:hypothetical protein EIP86_005542 [Pleurotus ostreatoroseus]